MVVSFFLDFFIFISWAHTCIVCVGYPNKRENSYTQSRRHIGNLTQRDNFLTKCQEKLSFPEDMEESSIKPQGSMEISWKNRRLTVTIQRDGLKQQLVLVMDEWSDMVVRNVSVIATADFDSLHHSKYFTLTHTLKMTPFGTFFFQRSDIRQIKTTTVSGDNVK